MTNEEKFKEVFGFKPRHQLECIAPEKICMNTKCDDCPFRDWWNKEYKECFKLKEDFEQ